MSRFGPGLLVSTEDGTATVTISNPERLNAISLGMWRALPGVLAGLAADAGVRVLVVTGEGGAFSAGADISGLTGAEGLAATREAATAAEEALAAFPKPTLAVVRGYCVGGGCQLAVACDLRFAAEGARFGVTPAKLGIVYPAASTRRLVALTSPSTAKYLLFSADLIDHERALRTGLVDEVHPEAALDARVRAFTRLLATRSHLTQAAAKDFTTPDPLPAARLAFWHEQTVSPSATTEATEGATAFLTHRTPHFTWSPQ